MLTATTLRSALSPSVRASTQSAFQFLRPTYQNVPSQLWIPQHHPRYIKQEWIIQTPDVSSNRCDRLTAFPADVANVLVALLITISIFNLRVPWRSSAQWNTCFSPGFWVYFAFIFLSFNFASSSVAHCYKHLFFLHSIPRVMVTLLKLRSFLIMLISHHLFLYSALYLSNIRQCFLWRTEFRLSKLGQNRHS